MRTILAATAAVTAVALAAPGKPAVAQQNPAQQQSPMTRDPALNPSLGPDAKPIEAPSDAANKAGDQNPAAHTASGCGTTDAQLAKTPPMSTPCPPDGKDPTPGSGVRK